ncbi:hypothetical protein [Nocardioides sp. Leaf285]|uniref:hypothetical protein n=1 Tax=Nocardioides sp. Leaf285 TaxID=1736322 RepID=UPI00070246D0|nr:hypothetical protein [Nocardioides sp. Leaf285]KQP63152.1 hypothetical protein ASF47_19270 [Nocardioides sp. Leaf285]
MNATLTTDATANVAPVPTLRPGLMAYLRDRSAVRREATGAKQAGLALLDVLLGMAIFALIIIIAIQSAGRGARRDDRLHRPLLDVLLGMAIFALIIIIAIQSVNQYRQRAFQSAAQSDAQQVAIGLESYFTDKQTYPGASGTGAAATIAAADLTAMGVNLTEGVSINSYAPSAATGTFTFCAVHKSGGTGAANVDAWARYASATGAILDSGRGQSGMPAACSA